MNSRKVLLIGFFQPYTIIGGSFRILPLMRHLPDFGWEPAVLTPKLLEKPEKPFRTLETDYRDIYRFWRRLFGFGEKDTFKRELQGRLGAASRSRAVEFLMNRAGEVINYPDPYRGWYSYALEAGRRALAGDGYQAIMSCHPVTSHMVASRLKKETGLPWVADLPDLWSRNHNYRYTPVRRLLDTRLEKKTLDPADVLTTVSGPWARTLGNLHRNTRVEFIPHGYPPDELNEPPVTLTEKFTITYTGAIYPGAQDFSKLMAAVRELINEGKIPEQKIELRFYGPPVAEVEKLIQENGLAGIARQNGTVPRKQALQRQRETQLLVYPKWKFRKDTGTYSAKIYEYLAARRPVLAIDGERDVVTELLEDTQAGIDAREYETVKQVLLAIYREYEQYGRVCYHGRTSEIQKYSHLEMAGKFARLFDSLTIDS